MKQTLRIGTRNSRLARWQTGRIISLLKATSPGIALEVIPITTTGDRVTDKPLSQIGNQGLFTKELEQALLENRIDLAVHSMKDLESQLPDGLVLGAVPEREDVRDVIISKTAKSIEELPEGAKIFTGSLRRRAQLLNFRNDFRIEDIRGNVETRLRKFRESDFDALIMAAAGMLRLGLSKDIAGFIPAGTLLPAVGQGALAIEIRADDGFARSQCSSINNETHFMVSEAERRFMNVLQGGCRIPIGGLGKISGETLELRGMLASIDGSKIVRESVSGSKRDTRLLGEQLARKVLEAGGNEIRAGFQE